MTNKIQNIEDLRAEKQKEINAKYADKIHEEFSDMFIVTNGALHDMAFSWFLDEYDAKLITPKRKKFGSRLLEILNNIVVINNDLIKDSKKIRLFKKLPHALTARLMQHLYTIRNISFLDSKHSHYIKKTGTLLSYYCGKSFKDPLNYGLYIADEDKIKSFVYDFDSSFDEDDAKKVIKIIKDTAPIVRQTHDDNLLAVRDYIYDIKNDRRIDFSKKYVFTKKLPVNYNPDAEDVAINMPDGNIWSVDSFFKSISCNDPEIEKVLWQVTSSVVGINKNLNTCALLYSERGNNGKGTFCAMLRALIGHYNACSIPLDQWSERFAKEVLIGSKAVIVDENNVGKYIEESADLKAAVTGDMINIDIKNKTPIQYVFDGFMVQCINSIPKAKDNSDSYFRRFLMIEFGADFRGVENKDIKNDYILREEVLEYILYRAIKLGEFKELTVPQSSERLMNETKETNNSVLEFWNEMKYEFSWDILPYGFIFGVYKGWYEENMGGRSAGSKKNFLKELKKIVKYDQYWSYTVGDEKIRTVDRLDKPEPLVLKYNLEDWKNKQYKSEDPEVKAIPTDIAANYRCFYRSKIKEEE